MMKPDIEFGLTQTPDGLYFAVVKGSYNTNDLELHRRIVRVLARLNRGRI